MWASRQTERQKEQWEEAGEHDSPEIPEREETSDIPGLPSGTLQKDYGLL